LWGGGGGGKKGKEKVLVRAVRAFSRRPTDRPSDGCVHGGDDDCDDNVGECFYLSPNMQHAAAADVATATV